MLKRFIYHLLEKRHYWRYVDFAELAELYVSRMLRILAVSMITVFVGIYLYKAGYGLTFIMLYFAAYFTIRGVLGVPSAFIVARIGPKHANFLSNILYVIALVAFVFVGQYGIYALAVFGILQAASVTLYEISYLVNFSKVKKAEHVGKEIGYMYMIERVATSLSPVIGGLVAYLLNPEATIILAAILFLLAAIPLFFTPEPTLTHQKITFRNFNWKATRRNFLAELAIGGDYVGTVTLWSLFVALAIFGTSSNLVYAQIGALTSITVLATLVFAKVYGVIVDRRAGGALLKFGVASNSVVHVLRPFVGTPVGVVLINIFNEVGTTAFTMPFTKGLFDTADNLPGFRIAYVTLMSAAANLGAALFASLVAVYTLYVSDITALQLGFFTAALSGLLIMAHGFPALQKRRFF